MRHLWTASVGEAPLVAVVIGICDKVLLVQRCYDVMGTPRHSLNLDGQAVQLIFFRLDLYSDNFGRRDAKHVDAVRAVASVLNFVNDATAGANEAQPRNCGVTHIGFTSAAVRWH
ncbi:MAG: hypothetical protein ACRCS3_13735 [Paracoccaceae bacterium]